jgi:hypothetical protein
MKPKAGEPSFEQLCHDVSTNFSGTLAIKLRDVHQREVREARERAIEEAAKIVEPWPHEPPHVVTILSKRAVNIRALAARAQEDK